MENKKKTIFNVVFLLVVFVGTIYGVFHGEDLGEIAQIIKTVNPLWLIPGVVCVVVFIWGESIIIYYMMHTLGIRLKKRTCFLFSSVGFFFSCITPSASVTDSVPHRRGIFEYPDIEAGDSSICEK